MADLILRYQSQRKTKEKPQSEHAYLEMNKPSQIIEVFISVKKIVDIFSKVIFILI